MHKLGAVAAMSCLLAATAAACAAFSGSSGGGSETTDAKDAQLTTTDDGSTSGGSSPAIDAGTSDVVDASDATAPSDAAHVNDGRAIAQCMTPPFVDSPNGLNLSAQQSGCNPTASNSNQTVNGTLCYELECGKDSDAGPYNVLVTPPAATVTHEDIGFAVSLETGFVHVFAQVIGVLAGNGNLLFVSDGSGLAIEGNGISYAKFVPSSTYPVIGKHSIIIHIDGISKTIEVNIDGAVQTFAAPVADSLAPQLQLGPYLALPGTGTATDCYSAVQVFACE